jgi:hypothetical protein
MSRQFGSSLQERRCAMKKPESVKETEDQLLDMKGPAAIVGEEWLRPTEGHGSVISHPAMRSGPVNQPTTSTTRLAEKW